MAAYPDPEKRRSLTVKLPGGAEVTVRGYDIVVVVICGVLGAMAYAGITWRETIAAEHKDLKAEQVKTTEAMGEVVYVLLQSPEQREELARQMDMPESLRKKVRR